MNRYLIASIVLLSVSVHSAGALNLLKAEPGKGMLKEGAVVFVDDGTCGKGKVKRVLGGNGSKGIPRKTTCVAAPK